VKIFQKTLNKKVTFKGISLHAGEVTTINLLPAKINQGIIFKRIDLKNSKPTLASWNNVKVANLCTMIKNSKGESVSTIEHLMFALYALEITNVTIEVDGPEIPILDGSSLLFIQELITSGISEQKTEMPELIINNSVEVVEQNKFIKYEPNQNKYLEIDYTLDYKDQLIKKQRKVVKNIQNSYKEIYNARTFCHQEDLEKIFAMGLAKGGSLDNAIVISGKKVLNQEGLRYKDEFVRHKILDCAGDLYLSGFFIKGKITCNQGGHELTNKLLQKILSNPKNYTINNMEKSLKKKLITTAKPNISYKVAI
jgi:UDP-3-O-[3-hydroxymyristoyl] N-acetylglucosamine deacetylase